MDPIRSLVACLLALASTLDATAAKQSAEPGYVGSGICTECHQAEYTAWQGSHHDLAMAEASDETVLGDFADAKITAHGVTSTFFRRDDGWYVRTDGPDGELQDYRIAYTFGWYPLQQYLIALPRGHIQSLGLAWDSRARDEGGQRWFHLYPDEEEMDHRHPLHWTARAQNWNYQCAECHSTELRKQYDLATDSFATTWAEIDVACEACHGPGAMHVEQARATAAGTSTAWDANKGLAVDLTDRDGGSWSIDPTTGTPSRSVPRTDHTKIELCARCHSRRGQIHDQYIVGEPLSNTHRLALLEERLYFPDGQIKDEVYVHGSFLQSKMFHAGVTCTDCHNAHSLKLKADGDMVCAQCHELGRYAAEDHHHHQPGTPGAACVDCHMPQRFYMVNDERADHSMRIPRPDQSLKLGSPNACTLCHQDKPVHWATEAEAHWYGDRTSEKPHFGETLHAGRTGAPDADKRLMALAVDREQPDIARATALELLRAYPRPAHLMSLPSLLSDQDPLVRGAAVRYLEMADPEILFKLVMPLLEDPARTVRLEAARTLAALLGYQLPGTDRARLETALDAYRASQLVNAELPESHLNIALVEMAQGKVAMARKAYRTALRLDPGFVPAYVNLADLYRALGSDAEGEAVLRAGLTQAPQNGDLHYALGLCLIRGKQLDEAIAALGRAAELVPDNPRYAYVHALAMQQAGNLDGALQVLADAYGRHPTDRDILMALTTISRDVGRRTDALSYAQALRRRYPKDPDAAMLVRELSAEQ